MAFKVNQKKDFTIKKGTPLVGGLKPEKVDKRKVTEHTPGAPLVRDDNFGNSGTNSKKNRMKFDY